MSCHWYCID